MVLHLVRFLYFTGKPRIMSAFYISNEPRFYSTSFKYCSMDSAAVATNVSNCSNSLSIILCFQIPCYRLVRCHSNTYLLPALSLQIWTGIFREHGKMNSAPNVESSFAITVACTNMRNTSVARIQGFTVNCAHIVPNRRAICDDMCWCYIALRGTRIIILVWLNRLNQ